MRIRHLDAYTQRDSIAQMQQKVKLILKSDLELDRIQVPTELRVSRTCRIAAPKVVAEKIL